MGHKYLFRGKSGRDLPRWVLVDGDKISTSNQREGKLAFARRKGLLRDTGLFISGLTHYSSNHVYDKHEKVAECRRTDAIRKYRVVFIKNLAARIAKGELATQWKGIKKAMGIDETKEYTSISDILAEFFTTW